MRGVPMSDTTPRPDETPGDPTAPAAAADSARASRPPAAGRSSPSPPTSSPSPAAYPAAAAAAAAAAAGLRRSDPRHGGRPAQPDVADRRAHLGHDRARLAARRHRSCPAAPWASSRRSVIYLIYKDRGPFVRPHSANALNVQIIGRHRHRRHLLPLTIIGPIIGFPLIIAARDLRRRRAPHRGHQGQQRRVVGPADDACTSSSDLSRAAAHRGGRACVRPPAGAAPRCRPAAGRAG